MRYDFDLELLIWLAGAAVLLSPVLVVLRRRGHSWPYLLAFLVLGLYLSLVGRETLVLNGVSGDEFYRYGFSDYVNLIPGKAGPHSWSGFDLTQVVINILLGVPVGFGLNFLKVIRVRTLPWAALSFGFTIEVLQLISSLIAGHPRHIADVNDLLLNALGVVVGYGVFRVLAHACRALGSDRRLRRSGRGNYFASAMARREDIPLR